MTILTKKFARRYQSALLEFMDRGDRTKLRSARAIGVKLQASGSNPKDLAIIHQEALMAHAVLDYTVAKRDRFIDLSGRFYAAAIAPMVESANLRLESSISRGRLLKMLGSRTVELAVSNVGRILDSTHRNLVVVALRKNQEHSDRLLIQANQLREHSKRLSQRLVCAQEDERKKISHELHDVIAQTLMGINIHLATLKKEAFNNTQGLGENITRTQQLVIKSVDIVHQFARRLRPTVLDDLGLAPALQAFMKEMARMTGMRMMLRTYTGIDKLDIDRRTTLFRVAQEALTNVARHAHASNVYITITHKQNIIHMTVRDDGRSFQVNRVMERTSHNHLGIIGMKERLEMINGSFNVVSSRGIGTIITADIPHPVSKRIVRKNLKLVTPETDNA
jgi:signal transduction histidine kinase